MRRLAVVSVVSWAMMTSPAQAEPVKCWRAKQVAEVVLHHVHQSMKHGLKLDHCAINSRGRRTVEAHIGPDFHARLCVWRVTKGWKVRMVMIDG